jgi:crotonobetainyl-CoA:carnitine CoA-transferase CaiB-like acyl-CoA transferase
MGSPLKLSDADYSREPVRRPPVLGEDTGAVLASIGIDATALVRLRAEGVI